MPRLSALWVFVFLAIALVTHQSDTGKNAMSRMLTLQAMATDHSFKIDRFYEHTNDWAQNSKGEIFSNKAPGSAFIAYPFFYVLNQVVGPTIQGIPSVATQWALSFLLQILPFALLGLWIARSLEKGNLSQSALLFFFTAFFLGNTASILTTFFVGHGLSAVLLLCTVIAIFERRLFCAGLLFGLSLLTDYGTVTLIPAFAAILWAQQRGQENKVKHWAALIIAGGLLPGVLWSWYHTTCFGSPFQLPHAEFSPTIERVEHSKSGLFSAIQIFPKFWISHQLMWGANRGLLWTQPWLVLVWFRAFLDLWKWRTTLSSPGLSWTLHQKLSLFCSFGLTGLYYMNACFPGWHGGSMPGPRYMSMIFPLFAWLGAFQFSIGGTRFRRWLITGLAFSLAFRVLVGSGSFLPPADGFIWNWYFQGLLTPRTGDEYWKASTLIAILTTALLLSRRWNLTQGKSCYTL